MLEMGFDKRELVKFLMLLGVTIELDPMKNVREEIETLAKTNPVVNALFKVCLDFTHKQIDKSVGFKSSAQVFDAYQDFFNTQKQEYFLVLNLDNKHRVIKETLVSKGTLNQSLVHPREVFADAVTHRAAAIVILHNHPGGDPYPSPEDHKVTTRLKEVSKIMGIELLDHVIIGSHSYYSFVDEDLM